MKDSLTQILVHLDGTARSADRLAVARQFAEAQGAAVAALYAVTPALVQLPFAPEAGASAAAFLQEIDDGRRDAARAAFDLVRPTLGERATWAEIDDYPIFAAFSEQALYADLLILGQHNPSDPAVGVPADFPETVIAISGKPALVVPYQGAPSTVGQNIVIAWKPTREAARAVGAALPLLQRARSVHVLSWYPEGASVTGDRLDLAKYLQVRGIKAAWHHDRGDEPDSLGELLLSRAFDLGADLLVMGCYGHSRAREWILGGSSRTVLQAMTLPVLMAH